MKIAKQRIRLDEQTEQTIYEALGVVDKVKDESLRLLDYIISHISEYAPEPDERMKKSERRFYVEYAEDYKITAILTVYYFRSETDKKYYRKSFRKHNPIYSKDDNEIDIELDVVNGYFDTSDFLCHLQHELHHGYQYYCKKRNNVEIKPNSVAYEKAKNLLALPYEDVHAAAAAVYLYGTLEMSAYENGLYAKLLTNYKSKNKKPISDVIHDTPFYKDYVMILNLKNELEHGGEVPAMFKMMIGYSKKKLLVIINKVIKKSQDVMAKAVAKAKIDYDDWVRTNGLGDNSNPYENARLKPLAENTIRLYSPIRNSWV